jgi:putative sugar O-methyltransferase
LKPEEKKAFSILNMMLEDMEEADALYRPTDFWATGLHSIVSDLKIHGFSSFRTQISANGYYVPLYEKPHYHAHKKLIEPITDWLDTLPYKKAGTDILRHLNGHSAALADYRVFKAADNPEEPPFLHGLSESETGNPKEQFIFDNKKYSLSFLNYLKGLAFLKKTAQPGPIGKTLEIGGGYGTLGEILIKSDSKALYINVDIPPVAAISTYYLTEVFGEDAVLSYDKTRTMNSIDLDKLPENCRAIVLCPWQLPGLKGKCDLFANFISFQEMEPHVVKNYIDLVQRHEPDHVLLRNLREGKKIKTTPEDIGVLQATLLDDMISWFDKYEVLARDTLTFGELKIDNFHSEVAILKKP